MLDLEKDSGTLMRLAMQSLRAKSWPRDQWGGWQGKGPAQAWTHHARTTVAQPLTGLLYKVRGLRWSLSEVREEVCAHVRVHVCSVLHNYQLLV